MRLITLFLATLLSFNALAVTINIDADSLKDASGNPITGGVIVLVADIKDFTGSGGRVARNGFSGPTATSFSGNDFLVQRWNFGPGAPEYFGPGAFQGSVSRPFSGGWAAGDPLRLYWFPANTASDTVPGPGKPFGTYRGNSAETGSVSSVAWVTPADSATLTINGETATVPKESTISVALLTSDAATLGSGALSPARAQATSTMVVGRYLFYNGSLWDGGNLAANATDDAAIAVDKAPLFGASTGNLANYTSYTRGINGLMVDISNPANGPAISAADFTFKVGNDNNPAGWANAPAPTSVTRRAGAGFNGSDRFTIIWPDNAIQKQWLQVTVAATSNTGLSSSETFYFGNAIAESGGSTAEARVNVVDENAVRNNPKGIGNPATITDVYDFNRDKRVNIIDENAARNAATTIATALRLIAVP